MTTDHHLAYRALIHRYVAAYNSFQLDELLSVLSPNISFEHYAGQERTTCANGTDQFRALAEQSAKLFLEREQRIRDLRFDGHMAFATIDFRGQLVADAAGMPGAAIVMSGSSEFAFGDGKIIRIVDRTA